MPPALLEAPAKALPVVVVILVPVVVLLAAPKLHIDGRRFGSAGSDGSRGDSARDHRASVEQGTAPWGPTSPSTCSSWRSCVSLA